MSKLEDVFKDLDKSYGKGSVIHVGNEKPIEPVDVISTGSLGLDLATHIGGVPRGRIIEILGPESSGKTTLASHIMVNGQKLGKVGIVDVEHTYDLLYAKALGLNMDSLYISQPDYGEAALGIVEKLAATGEFSVLVLDSVAAAIPKAQYEGEPGESRIGRHAALMSQECPKLKSAATKGNCLIIMLNQFRNKIGGYGNPEVGSGGDALKYYASMRFDIRKQVDKDNDRNKTTVKVIKSKVAPPFGTTSFYIDWGKGINRKNEILDFAIELEIVKKGGAWLTYDETKVQGEEKFITLMEDNPDFATALEQQVMSKLNP